MKKFDSVKIHYYLFFFWLCVVEGGGLFLCRFFDSSVCHLAVSAIVSRLFFFCSELCHSLMISTFVAFVFGCTLEVHLVFYLPPIHAEGNSCALLWRCSTGFPPVGFPFRPFKALQWASKGLNGYCRVHALSETLLFCFPGVNKNAKLKANPDALPTPNTCSPPFKFPLRFISKENIKGKIFTLDLAGEEEPGLLRPSRFGKRLAWRSLIFRFLRGFRGQRFVTFGAAMLCGFVGRAQTLGLSSIVCDATERRKEQENRAVVGEEIIVR